MILRSINHLKHPIPRLPRKEAGFSARLSPTSILEHLSLAKISKLSEAWKEALIGYGLAISTLQHAERILKCSETGGNMLTELLNTGRQGWKPLEHPDWLLFEIENDLLIRPVQAEIALEMMAPSSNENSILQLNMGEGKSSVIIPIVAVALANTEKLVRVVVLRSLSKQMLNRMIKRLGGLVGRRVYQLPVSRSLRPTMKMAKRIQNLYRLDQLLAGIAEVGNALISAQRWLNETSRDILDESDEILSRAIEFSPNRWTIIQAVLELAHNISRDVLKLFPLGLELRPAFSGSTRFRIRVLQPEAGQKLIEMIANRIREGGLPEVPVLHFPKVTRDILFRSLTTLSMTKGDLKLLDKLIFKLENRQDLLILRGLLAGGILMFAFTQKRWRVNLDLTYR
ncbi:hypothetical protein AJ79_07320 [Helicocarpus griseus UAMH5409]|uniref:ubiquitinyl hydrolase 1 n=1 Tax=Helicocarpus griseus UAMH5409 TaxID=1447875 RepID=A0A2B7X4M9_9EURO|nr:hypothetical protein AJ79_07320 [Helicocarpus griseus UAMH5409]